MFKMTVFICNPGDGTVSKNFDWFGLGQLFLLGLGRVSHLWFESGLEISS